MLKFSQKEYEYLRTDTAEIRNSITKYIGYIITLIGVSGFFKYIIDNRFTPIKVLFFISIILIIITFIFEIIWYKFKSHNRIVGYMQLLSQEQNIEEIILSKKRNKKNKRLCKEKKKIKHLITWVSMMSRLNDNYFCKFDTELDEKKQNIVRSINKCKFGFDIPETYIDNDQYHSSFFNDIIFKLYKDKYTHKKLLERINLKSITFIYKSIKYLFFKDSKVISSGINLDIQYFSNGWEYPRKITQIGFLSTVAIFLYFVKIIVASYTLTLTNITMGKVVPFLLSLVIIFVFLFWIYKYVYRLKDIIYGKYSIDSYCWEFFIYRVQLLNHKKIKPFYFSRGYIRYVKSKNYSNYIDEVYSNLEKNSYEINELIKSNITLNEFNSYKVKLQKFEKFDNDDLKVHKYIKRKFNDEK